MHHKLIGYGIIAAAFLVEIPRFTTVNWRIEGVENEPGFLIGLLVGIGSGFVIPAGTAYVFEAWRIERKGTRAWNILLAFFAAFLAAETVMLLPYVSAGIAGVPMAERVGLGLFNYVWSGVTTLTPLAVVAGTAFAMQTFESVQSSSTSSSRSVQPSVRTGDSKAFKTEGFPAPIERARAVRTDNKEQAMNALLDFFEQHPNATLNEAGQYIERAKSTVSNYLNELEEAGKLRRTDDGRVVVLSGARRAHNGRRGEPVPAGDRERGVS